MEFIYNVLNSFIFLINLEWFTSTLCEASLLPFAFDLPSTIPSIIKWNFETCQKTG